MLVCAMAPVKPSLAPDRRRPARRKSRRNRGLSQAKNRAILEAAARIFLESGFHHASMDRIARKARVSKQTVYNHYRAKEDLFSAIICDRAGGLVSGLAQRLHKGGRTADALTAFGEDFLSFLLSPAILAFYRLLVAEGGRRSELGAIAYAQGPARAVETLAAFLAERSRMGEMRVPDPRSSAEMLLGLLRGQHQLRALFGAGPAPSPQNLKAWVAGAVETFLAAHRA